MPALIRPGRPLPYRHRGKRLLDLAVALPALLLLAPLMAGIALLIRLRLGHPILFRQIRAGMEAQPFTIYKFRTMRDTHDSSGKPLPDAARLTTLGRLLRSTSLDELPELWNVITGDMSLVGPRPLLLHYLPHYSPTQARRHHVRPGLTGWAQINGRNAITWDAKFALDIWYVDHLSLRLDIQIIMKTCLKLLTREGISQPGQATAEPFIGSPHLDADRARYPG